MVAIEQALDGMILSASGWRGVFAESGDEEGRDQGISGAHRLIAAGAAAVFGGYIKGLSGGGDPGKVLVGMDTRPTGPALADAVIRALLALGLEVDFAGISAAPEIMAYTRGKFSFVFISASHNPIGHNGLKFGRNDGGVLPGSEAQKLIYAFRALAAGPGFQADMRALLERADTAALERVYAATSLVKACALRAYRSFAREVVFGKGPGAASLEEALFAGLKARPLGLAADLNGSARAVSIDRDFFTGLGLGYRSINDQAGRIAHRIVPEGASLEPCRALLEELHREDPSFMLGYVPDCDGDRGNLVVWDDSAGRARSLEAQEVFALACMAELAALVWTGELSYGSDGRALVKAAVAVNDPTSLRVDRIAEAFDVRVFRAEVGEANVVNRARELREAGYLVRILGEGSAGGSITHPSSVRDPLSTVTALVKLLALRDRDGPFGIWLRRSGQDGVWQSDFSLTEVIATLPAFWSTGAYSPEAILRVKTEDHGLLKARYQGVFLREWAAKRADLARRWGFAGWEASAYLGTREIRNLEDFSEARRGGLRIVFKDAAAREIACIWMRGSGTEPVFRIMADAGDPALERELIEWQRRMVTLAEGS
ncbi:MAG: phosphatidylglycerol lysyltransferase [Treponema sp.]|jgi:phosphoglucomutase|nr:phosphatidylglycerol lysyltransferase [Treponema sp.]